jgi:transcriptional regulator with XRE-family HTH domain
MTDPKPSLGECLRDLRRRNDWTLAQVSAMTGLAVSTLSKVENNQMSLTYDKLLQLAQGMKVDIAELFGTRAPAGSAGRGRRAVSRQGEGRAIQTRTYDYVYVCAELSRKKMVPMIGLVRARSIKEFEDLIRHPGEEYTYVLEGELDLHTELYAPTRMKAGDSIYFDSTMGHAYVSVGDRPARILCVCTMTEQDLTAAVLEAEGIEPLPA